MTKRPKSFRLIQSITAGIAAEAKRNDRAASESLSRATTLLAPDEVAGGYDAGRALFTTFGGDARPLTLDDLVAFRKTIAKVGKAYRNGITAQAVIDRSTAVDRERANREIRTAVPVRAQHGRVSFVTNSGIGSQAKRHLVDVVLLEHSPAQPISPRQLARLEARGRLQFTCNCGRHKYWYAYLATVGGFEAGTPQTNFPKIRNPNLVGVACKHVLRVMKQLGTVPVLNQIERMIEIDRRTLTRGRPTAAILTESQAQELAAKQAREAGRARNSIVTTAAKARLARDGAARVARHRIGQVASIGRGRADTETRRQLAALARSNVITAHQLNKILEVI